MENNTELLNISLYYDYLLYGINETTSASHYVINKTIQES